MILTDEQFDLFFEKLKIFTLFKTEGNYSFRYDDDWEVMFNGVALEISRASTEEQILVFMSKEHKKRLKTLQDEKIKSFFNNFLQIK